MFNTAVFVHKEYIGDTERVDFNDLNIDIAIIPDCERHLKFLPFLSIKYICNEPYTLRLDIRGRNVNFTSLLIESAQIRYSSGKTVTIKQDDGHPLKLFFKEHPFWENGKLVRGIVIKQIFYRFEELIREKHSDGETLKVAISFTVMPAKKTFLIEQGFIGKTSKESAGFRATLFAH